MSDFAQTVKQQADIVKVIEGYIRLRKAGAQNYSGLCPFHKEKSPSFSVHAVRKFYHCFGCQASGDVFSFVGKIENVTFPEAVRIVAQKCGIPLPKREFSSPEQAAEVIRLLKLMLTASGKQGVPQGWVISPLLSNIYLTEMDGMLERAKETTRNGKYTYVEYARFADDLVVPIDAHPRNAWLLGAVNKLLREEFAKLQVEINEEKSRIVDLEHAESFGFPGFDFRRLRSMERQVWRAHYTPKMKKRTALLRKLKDVFRRFQSQPVDRVVQLINPILRGWVNYFAVGHSSECFSFIQDWVEKKIRRHMGRSRNRRGFGWKRWSRRWLYEELKLFNGYRVRRSSVPKALPV